MRRVLTNILVAFVLVTGLAAAPRNTNTDTGAVQAKTASRRSNHPKPYQVGTASWYGRYFHGKETASGEAYNMYRLTAAHRRLPLGTLVRVTNLETGDSVIVRVNDRGPVPRTRIIDLSYGAARVIGLSGAGIGAVRLDIVQPEPEPVPPPTEIAMYEAVLP